MAAWDEATSPQALQSFVRAKGRVANYSMPAALTRHHECRKAIGGLAARLTCFALNTYEFGIR
jgi:hypothetical protein